jgi:hypothetical protein
VRSLNLAVFSVAALLSTSTGALAQSAQPIPQTEERVVGVNNKSYTISISQTSKTAWLAVGDYMGKRLEVVGSSATNVARRWVAAARLKGNE